MKLWQAGMPAQPKMCFNWCSCPLIPLKVAKLRAQLSVRYTKLLSLFREAIWDGGKSQPKSQKAKGSISDFHQHMVYVQKTLFSLLVPQALCELLSIFTLKPCFLELFIISKARGTSEHHMDLQATLTSHQPRKKSLFPF